MWSPKYRLDWSSWLLEHIAVVRVLGYCDRIENGCNRWDRAALGYVQESQLRSTARVAVVEHWGGNGSVVAENTGSDRATAQWTYIAALDASRRYMYPDAVVSPRDLEPPSIRLSDLLKSICSASSHMTLAFFLFSEKLYSTLPRSHSEFASTRALVLPP